MKSFTATLLLGLGNQEISEDKKKKFSKQEDLNKIQIK